MKRNDRIVTRGHLSGHYYKVNEIAFDTPFGNEWEIPQRGKIM